MDQLTSKFFIAVQDKKSFILTPPISPVLTIYAKLIKFSSDGEHFAWCTDLNVFISESNSGKVEKTFNLGKIVALTWSPKKLFLIAYRRYKLNEGDNVFIINCESEKIISYTEPFIENWIPTFINDDTHLVRYNNNILSLYSSFDFVNSIKTLKELQMTHYSIPPNDDNLIVTFTQSKKGTPSSIELTKLNSMDVIISSVKRNKATDVVFLWSHCAEFLLAKVIVEEIGDATNYMGTQSTLYLMSSRSSFNKMIEFDTKKTQIHDVAWCPTESSFVVVYGSSPAQATLYGSNGLPKSHFKSLSCRNTILFNPQGDILCLAGFGNLRGKMEFWNFKTKKLVSRFVAEDSTLYCWSPDGRHIMTATTSPRIRIDNHLKIWHYSGKLVHKIDFPELYQALWRPQCLLSSTTEPIIDPMKDDTTQDEAFYRPSAKTQPKKNFPPGYNPVPPAVKKENVKKPSRLADAWSKKKSEEISEKLGALEIIDDPLEPMKETALLKDSLLDKPNEASSFLPIN